MTHNADLSSLYPNEDLGVGFDTDTNQGAINVMASPAKIGTCTIWSGTGAPAIGGNVGDLYIRTNASTDATYFYRCTTAGTAGNAVWAAITAA